MNVLPLHTLKSSYLWLLFSVFTTISSQAQTNFTGATDANWFTVTNWTNGLPAAGNNATIANDLVVNITQPLTVDFSIELYNGGGNATTLNANAPLTIKSTGLITSLATLNFNDNVTNEGTINSFVKATLATGKTMTIAPTGALNIQNNSPFQADGDITNNGIITNNGTFTNNGTLTSNKTFDNYRIFDNNKSLIIKTAGSRFNSVNGSVLTNKTGASIIISDANAQLVNEGTLTNDGSITINPTAQLNSSTGFLTNNKDITVNGVLFNDREVKNTGTIHITATGEYRGNVNGTLINEGTIKNEGKMDVLNKFENKANAIFINTSAASFSTQVGSMVINAGKFTNYGLMNSLGALINDDSFENFGSFMSSSGAKIDNNKNFTNNGLLSNIEKINNNANFINNGEIVNNGGGVITNNASAYFLVTKTGSISNAEAVINKGTFENAGTFMNKLRVINTGLFINDGNFVNETNGDVVNEGAGVFQNNGIYNGYGGFINVATLTNNNTFFVFGCGTLSNRASGTIQNTGEIAADGGLIFQKNTLTGNPIVTRNFGSVITGAISTTICEKSEVGLKQTGVLRATGTTIATPNIDPCQNIFLTIADADTTDFKIARYPACNKIGTYPVTLKIVTRNVLTYAGDEATCVTDLSVVDKREPLITGCPSDIIKTNVTGTGTTVTWTPPTAVDNCDGLITMTSNKNSGDNFPLGVTVVRYEAKDSRGNVGVCEFRIGVYGATNDKPCFIPKQIQLPSESCQNTPVAVAILDPAAEFTYNINFGANATPATIAGTNGTTSYNLEGQKTVRITASAPFCQSVSKDTTLTIIDCTKPCEVPQPLALPAATCMNGFATYTPTPLGTEYTYTWNFGAGAQGQLNTTGAPVTIKYPTAGQKTISLTVAGPKCAATTKTYTTEVFDCTQPCAIPTVNTPTAICQDAVSAYSINNPKSDLNYIWNFGVDAEPNVENGTIAFIKYKTIGTKDITVNISGKTCAAQTVTKTVAVTACTVCPTPTLSNAPNSACRGVAAIFKANDAGAGSTYTWFFGEDAAPATATGIGPHNVVYGKSGSKMVALTISGTNCSAQTTLKTIAVTDCACPTPDFTPIAASCKNKDIALSLNSPANGITYNWQLTDASVPTFTGTATTISYATAGVKPIKVTSTGAFCIPVSIIKGITVNGCDVPCDIPAITTSVINDNACKDANVTVAANNPSGTLTYTWNFGAGSTPATGNGITNAIKYTTLGEKTIQLAITGNDCAPSSTSKKINIKDCSLPCPTTDVVAPTRICSGTTNNFAATLIGAGYIYTWNFGTGATPATATGAGPHAVVLTGAGDKTVTLTITTEDGTCTSNIISRIVKVENCTTPCTTPQITAEATACRTKTTTFSAPTLGADFTYSWNFGLDATPLTATGAGPHTVTYAELGSKTVTLSVSGIYCATSTTSKPINIIECNNPCPTPTSIVAPTRACMNVAQDFSAVALTGNYVYTWNFGANATPTTATGVGIHKITYATAGTKTVTLTISNPDGTCVGTTTSRTVQVENCNTPCTAPQITSEATACRTKTTVFSAPSIAPEFTYTWNFGANATPATATGAGPHTVTYAAIGAKTVTLSVSGTYCAVAATTKSINIIECNNPCPTPTTIVAPTRVCMGTVQDFSVTPLEGVYIYTWNFGGGANPATTTGIGTHKVTYTTAGTKNITLTTSSSDNTCTSTPTSRTVQVENCAAPCTAPAAIVGATTVCKNTPTTYSTTNANNDYTYTWAFGTGSTPATATGVGPHSVTFASEGTKTITVTAKGTFCAAATTTQTTIVNNCTTPTPFCPTPVINSDAAGCMNKAMTFQTIAPISGSYTYAWNFGANATPATATGLGAHSVTYSTVGEKTVTLTIIGAQGTVCTTVITPKTINITNCTVTPPAPTVSCIGNLIENPSFETDYTGWKIWTPSSLSITTDKNSGSKAFIIGTNMGGFTVQNPITVIENETFNMSIYGKVANTTSMNFGYNFLDNTGKVVGEGTSRITSTIYQQYLLTGKAPATATKLILWFWKGEAVGNAYIDDVCVTKQTNSTACPTPVINSAAAACANTPVSFSTNSVGTNYIYTWNFGANANPASAIGIGAHNVTYTAIGTKSVSLTITGAQGTTCSSTTTLREVVITNCGTPTPVVACTNNLVANASFETDFTGWNIWTPATTTISTDKNSGLKAIRINNMGGFALQTPISVTPNDNVSVTVYGKNVGSSSATWGYNFLDINGNKVGEGPKSVTSTAYQAYTLSAKAPINAAKVTLWFWKGDTNGTMFIDDVCLTKQNAAPSTACPTPIINSDATGCVNKATAFSAANLGNYTYNWNFGAGASVPTATGVGAHNVTYSIVGSKIVTLTISGTTCSSVATTKLLAVADCANPQPTIACAGNIVPNPSFENNFADWNVWNPNSIIIIGDKNSGSKAARIGSADGGFALNTPLAVTGGSNIKLNLYAKTEGNNYASCGYNFLDANNNKLEEGTIPLASSTYQLYSKAIKTPANAAKMSLWFWKSGTTGYLYIDDVCITKDGGTITTPTCPTPTLVNAPTTGCTNTNLNLQATDLGTGYTYTWNFGTGATPSIGTGRGVHSVKFANAGTQQVSLTTSSATCTAKTLTHNIALTNCTTNTSNESITIATYPVNVQRAGNYIVKINYVAAQTRDIQVMLVSATGNFGASVKATVQAGSGSVSMPFTVGSTVPFGSKYAFSARMIKTATTPDVLIKSINSGNVTVGTATSTGRCITENGNLLRETWYNVAGSSVSSLTKSGVYPNNANVFDYLTSFQSTQSEVGDNYGERVRGYIIPTVSGNYTFHVTGDDEVQFFLSPTENPDEKTLAASVIGWTYENELDKYSTQKSKTIKLEAGKRYYTELLHKEGGYLDHFAVYWTLPNTTKPIIIEGANLAPWDNCTSPRQLVEDILPFTVYPNPTRDYLSVNLEAFKGREVRITVYNQFSGIVQNESIDRATEEPFVLDLQTIPSGLYFIQINSEGRSSVTRRFVVNKD